MKFFSLFFIFSHSRKLLSIFTKGLNRDNKTLVNNKWKDINKLECTANKWERVFSSSSCSGDKLSRLSGSVLNGNEFVIRKLSSLSLWAVDVFISPHFLFLLLATLLICCIACLFLLIYLLATFSFPFPNTCCQFFLHIFLIFYLIACFKWNLSWLILFILFL